MRLKYLLYRKTKYSNNIVQQNFLYAKIFVQTKTTSQVFDDNKNLRYLNMMSFRLNQMENKIKFGYFCTILIFSFLDYCLY